MAARTVRDDVADWRLQVALATRARLRADEEAAKRHTAAAADLQRSIEAQLRAGGREGQVGLLARIREAIGRAEFARLETEQGMPGEDPEVLQLEVDSSIADLLRGVPEQGTVMGALAVTRARLRVHVEGPFLRDRADIDRLGDVEGARLIAATGGRIAPLEARAILRGEIYAELLSRPAWKWAAGDTANNALRLSHEALLSALRRSRSSEPRPTRDGLEAVLIQLARAIQAEIPAGQGTDADVDRFASLWRYALSPYLRAYVAREHPASSPSEVRGPFDSLVHDLVELAFRELGHGGINAPPLGGRSAGSWVSELRRRRGEVVRLVDVYPVRR